MPLRGSVRRDITEAVSLRAGWLVAASKLMASQAMGTTALSVGDDAPYGCRTASSGSRCVSPVSMDRKQLTAFRDRWKEAVAATGANRI